MKNLGLALLALAIVQLAGAREFYVSPNGSPDATGDVDHPWDLATALAQPAPVQPGDTIWLRDGIYRGTFVANLNGAPSAPVVVRQYAGERATIDGSFVVAGSYAWYWGFEIMSSDPNRVSQQAGSNPSDIIRGGVSTEQSARTGDGLKFIDLVLHDLLGVGLWKEATNVEFYGSLVYHNGWIAPDRGHGHGLYVQNRDGNTLLRDNVIFENFCNGIQVYGTQGSTLDDISIVGNTIFDNGEIIGSPADNITIGGGVVAHRPQIADNFVYFSRWGDGNDLDLGYAQLGLGTDHATVTGNHFINGVIKQNGGNTGTVMSGNTIYASIFGWPAGEFPSNKYLSARPASTAAFVRPDLYDPRRAIIAAYTGDGALDVPADVSAVLSPGQTYEVRNARDFYGPTVTNGTYDGEPIALPMQGLGVAPPVGWPAPPPSSEFNVFILTATSEAPPPAPAPAPAPAPPPSPAPPLPSNPEPPAPPPPAGPAQGSDDPGTGAHQPPS